MGRQMRLDQYISTYVEITRKEAKEAIRRGPVCVSGTVVKQANCKIDSEEDVTYCGKEIRAEEFVYYMLSRQVWFRQQKMRRSVPSFPCCRR